MYVIFCSILGRVALGAQRPIVVQLSSERSVGRSLRRSVCLSSALWKTADRIRMPFGIVSRTGPGMSQVLGFGDRLREGVLLLANLGRAIVTNWHFTAHVCDGASTVIAAVWGGACGGPRHCCICLLYTSDAADE